MKKLRRKNIEKIEKIQHIWQEKVKLSPILNEQNIFQLYLSILFKKILIYFFNIFLEI